MEFITPVEISQDSESWTDVDVSAHIPSGATGVILHVQNVGGSQIAVGFRKNGSTDDRTTTLYHDSSHMWCAIGVDTN